MVKKEKQTGGGKTHKGVFLFFFVFCFSFPECGDDKRLRST